MPRRRIVIQPPAIPAGSWRAAGNRFLVPLRRPVQERMESFRNVRTVQIGGNGLAAGVMSGSGTVTVSVGPSGYGTRWYPNQVNIATQTGALDTSTCTFYYNVVGPGGFLAQSYAGGGDQVGLALPEMQPGDLLYAVWAGGHAGDWTQVLVIGNQDVLVP